MATNFKLCNRALLNNEQLFTYLTGLSGKLLKTIIYFSLIYAINFYTAYNSFAVNYHIKVTGTSSGNGSISNPWDLATALTGRNIAPGDTLWLHGGTYLGPFVSQLRGNETANIVLAQYPGETAILDGLNVPPSGVILQINGAYTTYYGFQVINSTINRTTSLSGGTPSDLNVAGGINVNGPNVKLINLIVRDNVGVGVGFWSSAVNSEMIGNIIYNNGWQGGDRGHGHGIYAQNENGFKLIKDNILFGGFGAGIHIYGQRGGLTGFNIEDNIIFNSGSLAKTASWNIIIGGDLPADKINLRNNHIYKSLTYNRVNVQLHYSSPTNRTLEFHNNTVVGGEPTVSVRNWDLVGFSNNELIGRNRLLNLTVESSKINSYKWNTNSYQSPNTSNSLGGFSFDGWKKNYGYDQNGRFSTATPANKIVVKKNMYEKGAGSIIVHNHQGLSAVDVNLSGILTAGADYEIRDVENLMGKPIITGKYNGGNVRIPMNLTATDRPNGVANVSHSEIDFGVFIVKTVKNTSAPIVVNQPPTLNTISNPAAINEDAAVQTINLSGISAGPGENQPLTVTAISSNTTLIPHPTVHYTSPNATGSITYTPVANRWGTATITVTVNDGQSSNNTISRTFQVTVNAVNDPPTLNAISNVSVAGNSGTHTINLAGISPGPFETQNLTVTATSSNTNLIPNPTVIYTSPAATGSLRFTPVTNQSGTATITVRVTDDGPSGAPNVNTFTRTFTITVGAIVNKPPTLNPISNPTAIDEDSPRQTINLTGITAGEGESQTLVITAVSDNTTLIPHPTVSYTSPNATGSISYTPAPNRSGSAKITVTVNDGAAENNTISRTFTVVVNEINDAPQINAIANVSVEANSSARTINLAGINAGPFENQALTVTATSSNTALIPNPTISYTSPATTGTLIFTPVANQSGTATITVRVTDNGSNTAPHVNTFTRTFTVTVAAIVNKPPTLNTINDPAEINEDAPIQTINLAGITAGEGESQTLTVTATSDNTVLIPHPKVNYTSPNATGTITYQPVANRFGSAKITVTVNDNQSVNNTISRTFTVRVLPVNDPPALSAIPNLALNVNAPEQTVNLAGINAGPFETQQLTIVATSSNTGLIPNPTVTYTSPNATGRLTFTPVSNKTGTATITVRVTDDGPSDLPNINTFTRTFTVSVSGNTENTATPPTINNISDINNLVENSSTQTIRLTGIGPGSGDAKNLKVTATSDKTDIIATPVVIYTAPNNFADLRFTPVQNKTGVVTISVTVDNGNSTNNITTKSFKVSIVPGAGNGTLPTVTTFNLINTVNNTVITTLQDGMTLYTSKLPVKLDQLNVDALVSHVFPGSVVFGFNNNSRYSIENHAAYAIAGNTGPQFHRWNGLTPGVHTITATPFSNTGGTGEKGLTTKVTITVVDDFATNSFGDVTSLYVVNGLNNQILFELRNGMTIDAKDLPVAVNQLNIGATINTSTTGSVIFSFNNNQRYRVENLAPYLIAPTSTSTTYRWDALTVGTHTITATTYSARSGGGEKGKPFEVKFNIINSLSASSKTAPIVSSIKRSIPENDPYEFKREDFLTAFKDENGENLNRIKIISLPTTGNLEFYGEAVYAGKEILADDITNLKYIPGEELTQGDDFKWNGSNGLFYAPQHATVKLIPMKENLQEIKFELAKYWPNPVQNKLSVLFSSPTSNSINVIFSTTNGKVVKNLKTNANEGTNELLLDVDDLNRGIYLISIVSDFNKIDFKIIKD